MEYLLFTYTNCLKCETFKGFLEQSALNGSEHNLALKESKMKIREYMGVLKRDEKGAIIIPTLILQDGEGVVAVLNSEQELREWLRSKD